MQQIKSSHNVICLNCMLLLWCWCPEHTKPWKPIGDHHICSWHIPQTSNFVRNSYMGIIMNHYKDPYYLTSIMESKTVFFMAHLALFLSTGCSTCLQVHWRHLFSLRRLEHWQPLGIGAGVLGQQALNLVREFMDADARGKDTGFEKRCWDMDRGASKCLWPNVWGIAIQTNGSRRHVLVERSTAVSCWHHGWVLCFDGHWCDICLDMRHGATVVAFCAYQC